jgi:hypothetical protein
MYIYEVSARSFGVASHVYVDLAETDASPVFYISRPASVAKAEVGSDGLNSSRTPAAAFVVVSFVVVFITLRRAASPAQRAVVAAAAS